MTLEDAQQTEGLRLFKNTKGYNWDIKIASLDIGKLEALNKEMSQRFGNPKKIKEGVIKKE